MTLRAEDFPRERWVQLGVALVRRRNYLGWPKRVPFAQAGGVSGPAGKLAESLLGDIEKGRERTFLDITTIRIENQYGLAPGALREYLEGAPELKIKPDVQPLSRPAPSPLARSADELMEKLGIDPDDVSTALRVLKRLDRGSNRGGSRQAAS